MLKTWPLTTVQRWAASPNSFTLDFGDYSDSFYSVQTTEGETISQLIAGYIDIVMKKVRSKKCSVDLECLMVVIYIFRKKHVSLNQIKKMMKMPSLSLKLEAKGNFYVILSWKYLFNINCCCNLIRRDKLTCCCWRVQLFAAFLSDDSSVAFEHLGTQFVSLGSIVSPLGFFNDSRFAMLWKESISLDAQKKWMNHLKNIFGTVRKYFLTDASTRLRLIRL